MENMQSRFIAPLLEVEWNEMVGDWKNHQYQHTACDLALMVAGLLVDCPLIAVPCISGPTIERMDLPRVSSQLLSRKVTEMTIAETDSAVGGGEMCSEIFTRWWWMQNVPPCESEQTAKKDKGRCVSE